MERHPQTLERHARLASPETTIEEKQQYVNALRDNVEELLTGATSQDCVIETLIRILNSVKPQQESNVEHKLRKSILEVINRIPHTRVMREHVSKLSRTLVQVATEDNQENAIVAVKVVLDLLRAFKPGLEEVASPLLHLFTQLYDQWEAMYRHYFTDMNRRRDYGEGSSLGRGVDGHASEAVLNMDMQPSRRSFRVIAECPITVLHLVQLYGSEIRPHIPPLIALMVKALSFEGSASVAPYLQQAHKDMKFAQVKTVAFLSHYVKHSVQLMQPHEQAICDGLMNLHKSCPDVVQWRRELLISTRTLLATDFRKTLDERLNDLKDESAIVGGSRSCYEALRHYGYAVFAELAHQTRQTLTLEQLSWIIHRSCCIISDTERPASSHSTAIRLLLHLVEVIHRQRNCPDGTLEETPRELLQKILMCFAVKLNSVKRLKKINSDVQMLLQNLFLGLRTVLYSLTTYNKISGTTPSANPSIPTSLTEQEIRLAVKIVKGGIEGLRMCIRLKMQGNASDLMEQFVDGLVYFDPRDFVEIISARIGYIFTALNETTELHPIVSMFLEKPKIGFHFLSIMAGYMADNKLDVLADHELEEYRFVLKLFKLLFHTLLKQDIHACMATGDQKTLPLIGTLVKIAKVCLEKARTCVRCHGYLQLLRFLFRYLNRTRLQIYEMVLLLPSALNLFLSMLDGPDIGVPSELLIELCLLLPLELEKKYPVLPKLMKPLLMALKGPDEMAMLAIQTMEEWIDRLNPEFLEPAMSAVVQEINVALWSHLKLMHGGSLGPKVLQLLGKLGGRNRRFLAEPLQLEWKENADHEVRLLLTFFPDTRFLIPLDRCIALTCKSLFDRTSAPSSKDPENDVYYRRQGMQFLHVCLAAMMNLPPGNQQTLHQETLKCTILSGTPLPSFSALDPVTETQPPQIKSQHSKETQTMITLIVASMTLCTDVDLKDEAMIFVQGICRHFAFLFHLPSHESQLDEIRARLRGGDNMASPTHVGRYIEPNVFVDALMQVLAHEKTAVSRCGARLLSYFLQALLIINREKAETSDVVMLDSMPLGAQRGRRCDTEPSGDAAKECGLPSVVNDVLCGVMDCCFGDNWAVRSGGIYGVKAIVDEMPSAYLLRVFRELLRGLLHLMQALPSHCLTFRALLRELLLKLVNKAVVNQLAEPSMLTSLEEPPELTQGISELCLTLFMLNIQETVREDCNECLKIIAQSLRKSLADIVDPFVTMEAKMQNNTVQPKSLRKSLEECIQIAQKSKARHIIPASLAPHVEGLSRLLIYCIQQRLPSLPSLLQQILSCADIAIMLCETTDDPTLPRGWTTMRQDRVTLITKMRESSLKMLVTLSDWEVFTNRAEHIDVKKTFDGMLRLFFRMLIAPDDKLRSIARTGLEYAIQANRVEQADCQPSLKPILSRLNKYPSLDLNVLRGGAEAIRLLSDWFNLTLGEKLLSHLKKWLEPDMNISVNKTWTAADDIKIAAAILELFHLLNDSAKSFLESQKSGTDRIGLVVLTIELEERLGHVSPIGPIPHILWSPYRAPLTKFLIRYRREAIHYFLEPTRMHNPSYVTRFIDIIKSDIGAPLLEEVLHSGLQLISLLQSDAGPTDVGSSLMDIPSSMARVHALKLIKTVVKLRPEWLPTQPALFNLLRAYWREINVNERAAREEVMSSGELFESKAIAKCLLNYISIHHGEVEALVALLVVFECSSKVDFTFIKEYCMEFVPVNYADAELREVLSFVLNNLNRRMSQTQSIFVLRFLVIPILQSLIRRQAMMDVVTPDLIYVFLKQSRLKEYVRDVCLELELLDVGRLFIIGAPALCDGHYRCLMIKYAWNFLKGENIECKSHAFLLVAYLFKTKNWTDKTILQVFVNLLKSDFAETKRELVQEALDVMVPALAERFEAQIKPGNFPLWIEHAIKHMVSEGHKLNLLMNLWQMIIGHPDLFYEYRTQFLGQMVNTLSRLRRPPTNANSENRHMAIDMERVIVDWEVRRIKGSGNATSGGIVAPPPLAEETFTNMKKMVVAFLAKTVFAVPVDTSGEASTTKYSYGDIMGILSRALDVWPDVEFRLDFVERVIESSQMQHQTPFVVLTAGLDLVSLALRYQPVLFLEHGWRHLIVLAQKVVVMRKEDLLDKLCTSLETVFAMDEQNAVLQDTLESQLLAKYLDPGSISAHQVSTDFEVSACLRILQSDKHNRTGIIGRFLPHLVKLLEKHSREYISQLQNTPPSPQTQPLPTEPDALPVPHFGTQMCNNCIIIELCGDRLHDLAPRERETFVVSMVQFLWWKGGRFPDRAIFYRVLVTVSNWLKETMQNGESPCLSQKLLMWSMQQICKLDANGLVEPNMKKYFDGLFLSTMSDVCISSGVNAEFQKDVFSHVEQMLLSGIRTTSPELRKKFFQLHQQYLGSSLFERLKFVLQMQDWEQVASRFWLKQALDYLLSFLKGDETISFSPYSSQLVPLPTQMFEPVRVHSHDPLLEPGDMDVDGFERTPFDQLIFEHVQFINNKGYLCTDDLITPLTDFAHVHPALACHLWVSIFPIVWATLDKNGQISLAKPIIAILSKPYHAVQAHHRPNVVQGLLEGISLTQPQPKIPPELIKYLGKTYNAWHVAITLLESHVLIFPEESRCFDALSELYNLLSETDVMFGLSKKRFRNNYTQAAINLMQYGYWEEALHLFGEACVQSFESRSQATAREVTFWSEEWCRCAKELNMWEELHSWSESSRTVALMADAMWRLPEPEWGELRSCLQTAKEQFPDSLQYALLMVYCAFQENNTTMCSSQISHAIEQCLQKWWQLPEIGVLGQVNLLQKFQQVVELCETYRATIDLSSARSGRQDQSNFTKDIIETWRLRSPNAWEPLSVWSNVFMWRHIIYSSIASSTTAGTEPSSPALHHLCIKDKAWSINRLANVARKHGALDVCIDIENNMYNDSYMDVQEAFHKIVEQSKAYLLMEDQKLTGLTMLCQTNLDYFPYQELQSQIFRLQGEYYKALNDPDMAIQSFSTSVTLNAQFPEAWLSWGAFCDDMYEKQKPDPSSVAQLEYAIGCYFQAMHLHSTPATMMIPRCLELLSFDTSGTVDNVFKEFLSGADMIPPWYWLFYIPQILSVLHRPEGESLKYILPRIIQTHPQALYYFLRVHMLNMREAAGVLLGKQKQNRGETGQGSSSQADPSQSTVNSASASREDPSLIGFKSNLKQNFETVKDWLDRLKQQLGPLSNTLELMLREIASNFMAKSEERLMAVVHVLLTRCYKVAGSEEMENPPGLVQELNSVCQACFSESRSPTTVNKDLKESFIRHLSPAADDFPKRLGELTDRLKKWRNLLSQYLDEQMPMSTQLRRESPVLQDLNLQGVEMPCQYSKTPDCFNDTPVYLEKIGSEIRTIRRQGNAFRRTAFFDSEGRKIHFILQHGHTSGQPASSEERMLQLICLFNRLLKKHNQCRGRFLKFFAPVIVPVWNKVRLVEEEPCFTTFVEAFEANCEMMGQEPDFAVLQFKRHIYSNYAPVATLAPAAFDNITMTVMENIFSQFMYKTLPSHNHLWVFKKQFCAQMALSALMSVMLSIGGRVPGKILFSRSTGKVLQMDFCPTVDTSGHVHQNEEPVPFRLTRNLTAFFTPFTVEGVFVTSMVVSAMALTQRHSNLRSCLSLFFRDELLAWASRKKSRSQYTSSMAELQPLVESNVDQAMQHIRNMCPTTPKIVVDDAPPPPGVVNKGVRELMEKATDKHNLCNMDPTWHPWY